MLSLFPASASAAINYTYDITLSLDLINLTRTAIQQTPTAQGLKFVGLSTSMFDVSVPPCVSVVVPAD